MTKGQDWAKITYHRATIKSRRTKIVKDKNGRTKGGIDLDDETIKKYQEQLDVLESKMAKDKEKMTTNERVDNAAEQVIANADVNADKTIECFQQGLSKLAPKKFSHINMWASESNCEEDDNLLTHYERGDDTAPCAKRFKVSDESDSRKLNIPASIEQQSAASSHPSGLAGLLDFNSKSIVHGSDDSDEEEQQDDALLAKIKIHKEQIPKREERSLRMKTELSKQEAPSGPWAVRLPPKTEAEKLSEKKEDMKREYDRRQMQIFRLAQKVKQLDVFSEKYKEFEKQEDLLEWLQDVLEQGSRLRD